MDRYLQFDHLELSEEPSFIRWAKGSTPQDSNDWDAWLSKYPDKADTVEKAKSIVLAMKFVEDKPTKNTEDKVWSAISNEINTSAKTLEKQTTSRRRVIQLIAYGAAAAVALVFLFQNIGSDFDTTVNVPYAMTETVNLPDGSEVIVNAGSTLEYDKASWNTDRKITLKGEAFFDVQKGSKFTVQTSSGSVEVLGTSFNVYDRADEFKVHCETGKVSVKSAGKETILNPEQAVTVKDEKHIFEDKVGETENRSTWRNGVFVYRGVPLQEVMEELKRQFDVKVEIPNDIVSEKYTGSFRKADLETALTEVLYPLNLNFTVEGKTVRVFK